MVFGLVIALLLLAFMFVELIKDYFWTYDLAAATYSCFLTLFMIPKKITNNLTEYDYFELENAYNDTKDEHRKLRERFLSTISLIDEGVIFYENDYSEVFLSDRAEELFGTPKSLKFKEHLNSIDPSDRNEYQKTIEHISSRSNNYKLKYRVIRNNQRFWVEEKGEFITVSNKKSIIAVIRPLDTNVFKETSYFAIDSLYTEDKMYPLLKDLLNNHKKFSFIVFELSNIPEINRKYGRIAGNLLMNDYLKFIKTTYQKEVSKVFRLSGIVFAMVIDDDASYEDFHKALISKQSLLYNLKIQIAGVDDMIKPNFGVVNYGGNKSTEINNIISIANKLLDEAKESNRRNYAVFGE